MNPYLEQLRSCKGAEELTALVERWDILSGNISKRAFDAPIVLPDLFMYTRPGFGNTTLLRLLSEYLESKGNLMNFYGQEKFFEFKLEYCKPGEGFDSLYRLIEAAEATAGFRSTFKGLVRINVDEWVGHHKEKHFLDFLQFLQIQTPQWLVLLTLSNMRENDQTKEMEGVVSMYLRIEKITLHLPSTKELLTYFESHLQKYGLSLTREAGKVIMESIDLLRKNKYFYGLHTITDFCNDVVYSLFSHSDTVEPEITAEMLVEFSAGSEYIKRVATKIKKTQTVGF